MFYRIGHTRSYKRLSINKTIFPKVAFGLEGRTYFEYTKLLEPIWEEQSCQYFQLYKAPLLPPWYRPKELVVEIKHGTFPDIYYDSYGIYVSEAARKIIEEYDTFGHQYWPVTLQNEAGEAVTQGQFYSLNIRRHLAIKQLGLAKKSSLNMPWSGVVSKQFLPTIQHHDELREKIETLPLWLHVGCLDELYMNNTLYDALLSAGMMGIDEYITVGNIEEGSAFMI